MELRKRHRVDFIALVEPRQGDEKAGKLARRLGMKNVDVVEASGFSGGIWFLWDD